MEGAARQSTANAECFTTKHPAIIEMANTNNAAKC